MHETFRMLGAEHEADLERHAAKWRRAKTLLNEPQAVTQAKRPTRPRQKASRALFALLVPRFRP